MAKHRVAVLGAGVIGLSTAICLQESGMDCHVTLIAESFSPNTTSDVSGGFWGLNLLGNEDPDLIRDVGRRTYEHIKALALSPEADTIGAVLVSGYYFHQTEYEHLDLMEGIVDNFRRLKPDEVVEHREYGFGFSYTAPMVNVTMYLEWLMHRFRKNGGRTVCHKVKSIEELIGRWDVVVNCSGLGAAELLKDKDMYPSRGQVIRVEAPWIKHFYFFHPKKGRTTYILPGINFVVVGGSAEYGDWSTNVKSDEEIEIWQGAIRNLPTLTHAKKIDSYVGLRPCRTTMRLEPEVIGHGPQALRVVHNYGHGGSGVAIHWGCAQLATSMVSDILNRATRKRALTWNKL